MPKPLIALALLCLQQPPAYRLDLPTASTTAQGLALALQSDVAAVGAVDGSGRVHVHRRVGADWQLGPEIASLEVTTSGELDHGFGQALASSHSGGRPRLAVGAPRRDLTGPDSGAVYPFDESPSGWVERAVIAPAPGCSHFGTEARLVVGAHSLPLGTTAMWLASHAAGFAAQPGGSAGNLCLGLPLYFQTWFRDAGGTNFSDALAVRFE